MDVVRVMVVVVVNNHDFERVFGGFARRLAAPVALDAATVGGALDGCLLDVSVAADDNSRVVAERCQVLAPGSLWHRCSTVCLSGWGSLKAYA